MRERPILFSGEMVRAILEGRKTQTRRVISPQPAWDAVREEWTYEDRRGVSRWSGPMGPAACSLHYGLLPSCPYGAPGDRLWVRETHAIVPATAYRQSTGVRQIEDPSDPDMAAIYREGWERSPPSRWRPSIYMPRWASRLLLEVEEVRVERLQAITEEDARAEGVQPAETTDGDLSFALGFADLWDSINGKRPGCAWSENPWVWAVSFRRMEEVRDA